MADDRCEDGCVRAGIMSDNAQNREDLFWAFF